MASKYRPSGQSGYRMQRLSQGLEGAQSGAALGSALGPGGALVGGLIGGAAGALRGGPSEAQQSRDAELNELLRRKQIDALGLTGEERRAMERQIKDPLRTQQREFANRMGGMDMGAGATAAQAIALQEQQARQQMDADADIALADLETKQSEEDLIRELQQEKQDELNREKKEAMKAAAGLATTATKAAEEFAEGSIAAEWQGILKDGIAGRLTDRMKSNLGDIGRSLRSESSPEKVAKGMSLFEEEVGLPSDALEKAEESRVALAEADAQADRDMLAQGRADIRAGLDAMGTPGGGPGIMGVNMPQRTTANIRGDIDAMSRPGLLGAELPTGQAIPEVTGQAAPPNAADLAAIGFAPAPGTVAQAPTVDRGGASRFLMNPARNPLLDPFAMPAPGAPLHNIPPELLAANPGGMTPDQLRLMGQSPWGVPPNAADLQALGLLPPGSMFPNLGAGTAYLDNPLYSSYGPSPMTSGLDTTPMVDPAAHTRRWRRQ